MRLRVLQVINSLGTGGAEKLLLDSIPIFQKEGVEMDILLLNGADQHFLKELKQRTNGNIYSLGTGSVYNPLHIFRIKEYLSPYDVIHVHLFPSLYWTLLSSLLLKNKPILIFTEHNTTNRRLKSVIFRAIDRIIYSYYNKIICISKEIECTLHQKLKLVPEKTILIKNGVDLNAITQAKPLDRSIISERISINNTLLIQVAGFRDQKDQPTLIRSLQYLPQHCKLLLVGNGKNKEKCIALTNKLNLTERVIFLGIRSDVPELLKTSDIVVLSSHHEGLSLSSIEGMASGKPFVASDVPGLREVVKGAGILFPVGDEKRLATILQSLIDNPEKAKAVADKCQQRAAEYEIETLVDHHIKLYKSLC